MVQKSWADVLMLDKVSPGLKTRYLIHFSPDASVHSGKITPRYDRSWVLFQGRSNIWEYLRPVKISDSVDIWSL